MVSRYYQLLFFTEEGKFLKSKHFPVDGALDFRNQNVAFEAIC